MAHNVSPIHERPKAVAPRAKERSDAAWMVLLNVVACTSPIKFAPLPGPLTSGRNGWMGKTGVATGMGTFPQNDRVTGGEPPIRLGGAMHANAKPAGTNVSLKKS